RRFISCLCRRQTSILLPGGENGSVVRLSHRLDNACHADRPVGRIDRGPFFSTAQSRLNYPDYVERAFPAAGRFICHAATTKSENRSRESLGRKQADRLCI